MKDVILTAEEAKRLFEAQKIIETNESSVRFSFKTGKPSVSFHVVSTDLPKQERFLLTIRKSEKKLAKITFHHMHDDTSQCLLRLDINGTHKNPEIATDCVPEQFKNYIGMLILESHVHYYVEGYNDLWALPISATEFNEWSKFSNIENEIQNMLNAFCKCISLSTPIFYDQKLPL